MRRCLFLVFTALLTVISAQAAYKSLDSANPITFLGNAIVYQGDTITLGKHAIFLDGNLADAEASEHPYVYNSLKQAVRHFVDGTDKMPMCV